MSIPFGQAAKMVFPGLWCRHGNNCNEGMCPVDIQIQLSRWAAHGIKGGWIWLYDDIRNCVGSNTCQGRSMSTSAYARAVSTGLVLWEKLSGQLGVALVSAKDQKEGSGDFRDLLVSCWTDDWNKEWTEWKEDWIIKPLKLPGWELYLSGASCFSDGRAQLLLNLKGSIKTC
jgi:hypothetical protein